MPALPGPQGLVQHPRVARVLPWASVPLAPGCPLGAKGLGYKHGQGTAMGHRGRTRAGDASGSASSWQDPHRARGSRRLRPKPVWMEAAAESGGRSQGVSGDSGVGGGSPRHRGWAGRPGGGRGPRAPALLVFLSPPGAQARSYCCHHTGRGSPTPGSQTASASWRGSRSPPTWAHRTRGCLSQGERANPLAGLS